MHDGIHAFHGVLDRLGVREVEDERFFMIRKVGDPGAVGEPDLVCKRSKPLAQLRAKASCGAGYQDRVVIFCHHMPNQNSSLATAAPIRFTASARTSSEVAVEMRKKGDRP